MFKNHLFHGITAGLVSGLACYLFYSTLRDEFMYDFSKIFTTMNELRDGLKANLNLYQFFISFLFYSTTRK